MLINPNAPVVPERSELMIMIEICRVLSTLRQQFFNVEKALSAEGITATQVAELEETQQQIAQKIVNYVLYERL